MVKKCSKCDKIKSAEDFGKRKLSNDGLQCWCKICLRYYTVKHHKNNKIQINTRHKRYYQNNKIQIRTKHSEYYKQYYQNNKEEKKKFNKQWCSDNKDRRKKYHKGYGFKNRGRINKRNNKRRHTDINYKLQIRLRSRVYSVLKNNQKVGSAVKDLGCTMSQLQQHLENQFKPGMTWNNWGIHGWHIDHIRPLSKFDLTNRWQFLKACNYANLQPLWAKDNLSKGCYYPN